MNGFNASDWALRHRSLVWFAMIASLIAGIMSYRSLGREEDPAFTIKVMVIQAQWPGATTEETIQQVTERIERKLEENEALDFARSYTVPGVTTVFVNLKDTVKGKDIPQIWNQIRNQINDIRGQFPSGTLGPFFNDRFGDVYGNIYAFTADGLTFRQLRDYVEQVRAKILTVRNIGKVDLVGVQDEKIYLEFSPRQLAALGLDRTALIQALQAQNAITPSGVVQAGPERISVRVSGQFSSEESLRAVNFRIGERYYRLTDIATIRRGFEDPPKPMFRYRGEPAIGLAIAMAKNGNLLEFGDELKARLATIEADLPIGVGVHLVSDQPVVVRQAVSGFTRSLIEAVIIVMVVSFVSLGLRAGLVVACSIPLVLAMVFVFMEYNGITLQRISLGALIIALGLLVDDAMITVEMMVTKLEEGESLTRAATFAYTSTAFPMLTGTLVTVAGFVPIGLNNSSAGEYTYTLFLVIAAALLLSWIVAVFFAPLLGVVMLPKSMKKHGHQEGRMLGAFRRLLDRAMRWRWITIGATALIFAVSMYGMGFVQQQFFPSSDRPEIVIDLTLPKNASIAETRKQMDRFEAVLGADADIERWSSYVGQGAVRFLLSLDMQLANPFFGQIVIVTKGLEARKRVEARMHEMAARDFVGIDVLINPLELGPPVGRPIQYRISGPEIEKVRTLARDFAAVLRQNPAIGEVLYDWNEPSKVIRVEVAQDKARKLGVTSQDVAQMLNALVSGVAITQVRDGIYLIDVVARAVGEERGSIDTLRNLQVPLSGGRIVPLSAIADFRYETEQPLVWRRDRLPTITVKGGIVGKQQPPTVVASLAPAVKSFTERLPAEYRLQVGGTVENSAKSQGPIAAVVPLMLFIMATVLMIQLQSFAKLVLVFCVAPLGIIGVVAALLPTGVPLGFVAILGVLALIGIIVRNAVILVTQIDEFLEHGLDPWHAVLEATLHRVRPILLTAAAASLGMIPIAREVFWGPMAYAMIGGILAGTALTLVFLPALYVAWFRIQPPKAATPEDHPSAAAPQPV